MEVGTSAYVPQMKILTQGDHAKLYIGVLPAGPTPSTA
jgi:hypothetical protein